MYSLTEAAKAVNKGRPAIFKAIKLGKISAQKDENGEYRIDPAELHRVYPPVSKDVSRETSEETALAVLKKELEMTRQMLLMEQRRADDAEQQRDAWRLQCNNLLPEPKRSFWKRIFK